MRALVWVLASAVASLATAVSAQEKHPISISGDGVSSRYIEQHTINVDDITGHQLRVYELERTYTGPSVATIEGERVIESKGRGLTDYVNGVGTATSYWTWITDKGNRIFVVAIGASNAKLSETGSRRGTYNGTARIVGGSGRLSSIRGTLVETARFDTDPKSGYSFTESQGEYWLEK